MELLEKLLGLPRRDDVAGFFFAILGIIALSVDKAEWLGIPHFNKKSLKNPF
jgi:hypothetical protein